MRKAPIYHRLPSDAGVTFEGFAEVTLFSRQVVKQKLLDFLDFALSARAPAMRIVLGEWGEGKTDLFRRCIVPWCDTNKQRAVFVSASTLANSYGNRNVANLTSQTSLSSLRFMVALLHAAKTTNPGLPIPQTGQTPFEFLRECLSSLCRDETRLFFFIDEFEELLSSPRLNEIISGLKESLNPPQIADEISKSGSPESLLHETGEYEGAAHFVVSCTPDAFHKLQASGDTSLVFGGLGRRCAQIEITRIRKEEAIRFLNGLVDYSFEAKPVQTPLENAGVLQTLARVCQSNPGVMVSLFSRYFTFLKESSDEMRVANYETLLDFLANETIFVYGGQTRCVEMESLNRLLKTISPPGSRSEKSKSVELLRVILGELRPLDSVEAMDRIHTSEKDFKNIVAGINDSLRREEGIQMAVIKVRPLKHGLDFSAVKKTLSGFISVEEDTEVLRIGPYKEPLSALEDRLTWYEYDDKGSLVGRIFIPVDSESVRGIFDGASAEDSVEIASLLEKKASSDPVHALASETLLLRVFPTPVPPGLEFIKNRETRAKLWRDVTRNLPDLFEEKLPGAIIDLLNVTREATTTVLKKGHGFAVCSLDYHQSGEIRTLIFSINGEVEVAHIDEIWKMTRGQADPIHLVMVLHSGDLSLGALDSSRTKELGEEGQDVLLFLKVHPTAAKRIVTSSLVETSNPEVVDLNLYRTAAETWIKKDIGIPEQIDTWFMRQLSKGRVITDIKTQYSGKELADSLRFYINFMEHELKPDEALSKNLSELLRFVFFNARIGLVPDVTGPEKFKNMTLELLEAGFLAKGSTAEKYKVVLHPIEKRIVELLTGMGGATEESLEKCFIISSRGRRILSSVYLGLLEYRGIVTKVGGSYRLQERNKLLEEVRSSISELERRLGSPRVKNCAHVFVTKEREKRLIIPTETLDFAKSLLKSLDEALGESKDLINLQRLSLDSRILRHTLEEILPHINGAAAKSHEIINQIDARVEECERRLRVLCGNVKRWFAIEIDLSDLDEFKEITARRAEARSIHEAPTNREEIEKLISRLDSDDLSSFFYDRTDDDASWFNIKVWRLRTIDEENNDKISNYIEKILLQSEAKLDQLNTFERDIGTRLNALEAGSKGELTSQMLEMARNVDIHASTQLERKRRVNLADVRRYCENVGTRALAMLGSVRDCVVRIDNIKELESSFYKSLENANTHVNWAVQTLDIEPWKASADNLKSILDLVASGYSDLKPKERSQDSSVMLALLKDWQKKMPALEQKTVAVADQVTRLWADYLSELQGFVSGARHIVQLARERHQIASGSAFEYELEQLDKVLEKKDPQSLKSPISRLEPIKARSRRLMYSLIEPILSSQEVNILQAVLRLIEAREEKWLPLSEAHKELGKELDLTGKELDELLKGLISKKFLKGGVALSP